MKKSCWHESFLEGRHGSLRCLWWAWQRWELHGADGAVSWRPKHSVAHLAPATQLEGCGYHL